MMKSLIFTALALLAGCATQQAGDPFIESKARTPLICKDKAHCDLYWQRAQIWVQQNSRYRIQNVTDTIISTYGPFGSNVWLAYQVARVPQGDGGAEITIRAACDNMFGCNPNVTYAIAAFKQYVAVGN